MVERYAKVFMNNDKFASNVNCKDLIDHIDSVGGYENFAKTILNNKQKTSKKFKSETCYEVAQKLLQLKINTIDDFKNYKDTTLLEAVLYSIKGVGVAGFIICLCLQATKIVVNPTCIFIIVLKMLAELMFQILSARIYLPMQSHY